jgi:hypothetical protein
MDCYNQHTLGRRYPSKQSVASVHMLNETTLSFFETHQAQVYTVLSNSGREFYGTMTIIPANSGGGIEHRRTKVRRPQSNGFIDRLHRTLLDEHFRIKGRTTWYESVGQMQTDLDSYLEHYNNL